jgi:hypothetical protein
VDQRQVGDPGQCGHTMTVPVVHYQLKDNSVADVMAGID